MSGNFQGTVTPPPKKAPIGLVYFAALFDAIAIICYESTCQHQLAAWPSALQSKLVLLDSAKINTDLGIQNVDDHGYKVTQGHNAAWNMLNDPKVNNVLIFEDDYTAVNETVAKFVDETGGPSLRLFAVKKFLQSKEWSMLRLGYNPLSKGVEYTPMTECVSNCACTPSPEVAEICSTQLPVMANQPHCDVRSFVGYAVNKGAYPELSAFGHGSFDNFTMYNGLLSNAKEGYKGPKAARGYVSAPQDLFFPATMQSIHYFTPGFIYQEDKPVQVLPMMSFGQQCNAESTKGAYSDIYRSELQIAAATMVDSAITTADAVAAAAAAGPKKPPTMGGGWKGWRKWGDRREASLVA